jgi:hypothetical protein
MGLDQYINRKSYIQNWSFDKENKYEVVVTNNGNPTHIKSDKVTYVTEELGYFRKFNALHNWFVQLADGRDECQKIIFYEENVDNLLLTMKEVLISKSEDVALEMFPPVSGFFFGSIQIDEWYWKDLESSIKLFQEIKDEWVVDRTTYYYQASW